MDVRDTIARERAIREENQRRISAAKNWLADMESALTDSNATPGMGRIATRLRGIWRALDSEERRMGENRSQAPEPIRAMTDFFARENGAEVERMIHRRGNEAWFTITGDLNFYHATFTMQNGKPNVVISPKTPSPEVIKRWGRDNPSA